MLINAEAATGGVQKEALAQLFSCEFCEISKNTFFTEHYLQCILKLINHIKN